MASKRKADEPSPVEGRRATENGDGSASNSDGESTSSSFAPSAIDVSFNFVAPSEIDFQALKRLAQQLYYTHAPDLDLGVLADHVIKLGMGNSSVAAASGDDAPPHDALGTVVKVEDDEDGDPFAFASAIDLSQANSSSSSTSGPSSKALRDYYARVLTSNPGASSSTAAQKIHAALQSSHVVQVFHERMVNMPPQIMPPLYRMLFDEISASSTLNSATYLLFFSRVFSMQAVDDGDEDAEAEGEANNALKARSGSGKAKSKRSKKAAPVSNRAVTTAKALDVGAEKAADTAEVGLFHPEDAILSKYAEHTYTYRFPGVKDSDESFNAPIYARIVLVPRKAATVKAMLDDMDEALSVPMAMA